MLFYKSELSLGYQFGSYLVAEEKGECLKLIMYIYKMSHGEVNAFDFLLLFQF